MVIHDKIRDDEMKEKLTSEYKRRLRLILKSQLNGRNKTTAINTWGPVVQKSINATPRLKINQGVSFSTPKCCSTLIFGKTLHKKKSILKNINKQKKLSPKS